MSAKPNNGGGNNVRPSAAFMEKVERLSEVLFPKWSKVCAVLQKIDSMQKHRVELLKSESSSSQPSDAMAEALKQTSGLLDEVRNFRSQISTRVESLDNLDAVIKAEKAKIGEIMDEINFEATIDKMLRMDMSEFAFKAQMVSVEFSDWNCDSDTPLYTNLPMVETFELMLRWFAKKFWQAVKEEEDEQRHVKKAIVEVEVKEIMALATMTLDKPFIPRCFTCKEEGHVDRECPKVDIVEENGLNEEGKYAHLANRGQGVDRDKPKFCTICNKVGHVDEYCPLTHPEEEEEEENTCSYCGRTGHMVDGCWKVHPELRRVYFQKRKAQVCQNCRKSDDLTKYCPDGNSYKYGLRPVPER